MNEMMYAAAVGVVNALMQVVKATDVDEKFSRFYPLVAVLLGEVIGIGLGLNWFWSLTLGLTAMGLYRGAKVVVKGE